MNQSPEKTDPACLKIFILGWMTLVLVLVLADPLTHDLHNNGSGRPDHIRQVIDDLE